MLFHTEIKRPKVLSNRVPQYLDILLTFVPAVKIPPRAPLGPSEVLNAGIPFEGIAFDLQKSAATRRDTLFYQYIQSPASYKT